MQGRAEFDIIGNVGKISTFNGGVRLSICANYRRKGDNGERIDDAYWNTVTIFRDSTVRFVEQYVRVGDLVSARGRLRDTSYEKDGETVYSTDLLCNELGLLSSKEGAD